MVKRLTCIPPDAVTTHHTNRCLPVSHEGVKQQPPESAPHKNHDNHAANNQTLAHTQREMKKSQLQREKEKPLKGIPPQKTKLRNQPAQRSQHTVPTVLQPDDSTSESTSTPPT